MNKFAPVLIPTLNRHVHFKRCVESLAKCKHADKTDLYIAFDYPLNETHWEGYKVIKAFLPCIKGFKTINIFERKNNYGVRNNIDIAREKIFEKYDHMIFSEDDNEFSPNFLDFVNKGLHKFELDTNVYAICGYKHPIDIPDDYSSNYFFYRGFSAWGYGTWKYKFIQDYYSTKDLIEFIHNKENVKELKKISNRHYYNIIESIMKKESRRGDFTYFLTNSRNKTYSVFPTITKVKNHGHDGSGENCVKKDINRIDNQILDLNTKFKYQSHENPHNIVIDNQMKSFFSPTQKGKIKNFTYFFLYKVLQPYWNITINK